MTDHPRERQIFERCLEIPPEEWDAFVMKAVAGDSALYRRVMKLLQAHRRAEEGFLSQILDRPDYETPGEIGPYKILHRLGEGGMGTVYEAVQSEPLVRKVALKVVKLGMDTREVVARFEAELQALSVMDHPNIARALDAGVTPAGRPYFVMELVNGIPLHEYCKCEGLNTRARLRLFITLCQAVQHAHQKGIIHRDLKPTNVLVIEQDGKPMPKIIDFGVAKASGWRLTPKTLVTLDGQAVGTPAYMSPEQAGVSGLDVDTRSDIYSLGVMLYELLSGTLPLDPEEMGVHEFLARLARWETDPPLPSEKLDSPVLRANGSDSEKRRSELESLRRELKGDLDWIVMKAMEKDRSRRYETVRELALEIERYLNEEPVRARPPTPSYRFQKFVRRHKAGVFAAATAIVAVVLGVAGISVGLMRAKLAERDARRDELRAHEAEQRAIRRLHDSLAAQARANLSSGLPGRRHLTMELLGQAATLQDDADLRDEAIAALMLTDLVPVKEWDLPNENARTTVEFDGNLRRYAIGFEDGRLEIHSVSGDEVLSLPAIGHVPRLARFSPDGRMLAVKYHERNEMNRPALRVWDLKSGRAVLALDQAISGQSIDFDPAGRLVAYATWSGQLVLYEISSGRERVAVNLETPPVMIRFRPDGRALALANLEGRIEIRDLTGRIIRSIRHTVPATCLDWSRDGAYVAAGFYDYTARVWKVEDGRQIALLKGHQAEVVGVYFHPKAPLIVTYSWDETSRLWDVMTGRQLLVTGMRIKCLSDDGKQAAFVTSRTAGTMDVLHGDYFRTLYGHVGKSPFSLQLSADGRWIASAGPDGTILWETESGSRLAALPGSDIRDAIFTTEAARLFTCGREGFSEWFPIKSPLKVESLRPSRLSSRPCMSAAVDQLGNVKAVMEAGRIRIFAGDADSGKYLPGFRGMAGLEVSPGGEWIASGNWKGNQTEVWNTRTGSRVATLLPGTESVNVRFSPDGKWLATGSSDDYRLWHTGSWTEAFRFKRPKRFSHLPGTMDFSRDASLLAILEDQSSIHIVHVASGAAVAKLKLADPQAIVEIRFSNDGRRLVAATSTNQILIWELDMIRRELHALRLDDGLESMWPLKGIGGPGYQLVTNRNPR